MNIDTVIEEQLKLLDDFCIQVSDEEIEYMRSLPTEIAIENHTRTIIMNKLDAWTEI